MNNLLKSLCVITGGGIGAFLRYEAQNFVQMRTGASFPYGTLIVNVSGAFLIGLLMTLFTHHGDVPVEWRLFLVAGVLGGYTTFSALTWETYQLFAAGHMALGFLYILASSVGGAAAVLSGVWVGRVF